MSHYTPDRYRFAILQIRSIHPHRPLEPWVKGPRSGRRVWIGYASTVLRGAVFARFALTPEPAPPPQPSPALEGDQLELPEVLS